MEKLSRKNRVLMGITLFSMFFGAANLIFPPFLGAQAGKDTLLAMIGFGLSAIGLPILGIIAVTKSGGLYALTSRVHRNFSMIYILILYLTVGPFLAIPRTASTSFSMAVVPFVSEVKGSYQLVYSILFFGIAMCVALKPEKLTEYLGKKLTPCLLILIFVIFLGCVLHPTKGMGEAVGVYEGKAALQGFFDGYQTLDTLAALNFGMIIAMNIRAKGIKTEKAVVKETIYAGWVAGVVLVFVYGMLAYIGALSSQQFAGAADGTQTLIVMTQYLFGKVGIILLAFIFIIACFNTCVGLLSCCGKYFNEIMPKISYRNWVFLFAFVSMLISNVGLQNILKFSAPILNSLYPMAIVLIILAYAHPFIKKYKAIYPWMVGFSTVSSLIELLAHYEIKIPVLTTIVEKIPGYELGFGWILPALLGFVIGICVSFTHIDNNEYQEKSIES